MSDYRKAFPDFPVSDWPTTIPAGFVDTSWHNDVCPSLWNESLGLTIFIDYADAKKRELPKTTRFTVHEPMRAAAGVNELDTDDWGEVLAFVKKAADQRAFFDRALPDLATAKIWIEELVQRKLDFPFRGRSVADRNHRKGRSDLCRSRVAADSSPRCRTLRPRLDRSRWRLPDRIHAQGHGVMKDLRALGRLARRCIEFAIMMLIARAL